jgi:hypothetical protein
MVPSYPGQREEPIEENTAGLESDVKDLAHEGESGRSGLGVTRTVNKVDEGRKLFAHLLWSSAMVVAQGVEDATSSTSKPQTDSTHSTFSPNNADINQIWDVRDHRVLELGAGTTSFAISKSAHKSPITNLYGNQGPLSLPLSLSWHQLPTPPLQTTRLLQPSPAL